MLPMERTGSRFDPMGTVIPSGKFTGGPLHADLILKSGLWAEQRVMRHQFLILMPMPTSILRAGYPGCFAILRAHSANLGFTLKLPSKTLGPASGSDHRDRALMALARFDHNPDIEDYADA